jgi:Flp pilus assembly protein TadD
VAVEAFERAAERDPTDVKALANLGVLYERSGATDHAARAYRAALAVEPQLTTVSDRLARLDARSPADPERGGPPASGP